MVHCVARIDLYRGDGTVGPETDADTLKSPEPDVQDGEEPIHVYHLFNHEVLVADGDSALSNTGWRTWAGSWMLAKYLESRLASTSRSLRVLDLSCGTGLLGISLACAGHQVLLCDLDINVATVRANIARNSHVLKPIRVAGESRPQARASVVEYAWGRILPEEMCQAFDIVACGDLLHHVWSGRLQTEFLHTLQEIFRHGAEEFLFGFQVRSSRQEQQVLDTIRRRLHLVMEELGFAVDDAAESPLAPNMKYRLVRLRRPLPSEEVHDDCYVSSEHCCLEIKDAAGCEGVRPQELAGA
mmetsp:Transcript_60722/g.136816  ORF Transcript_60722/g.136816 Transcript_60722/m.136816 type:complete len:299 (+) Transcript_60722:134-1030(+)